ncbi:hypothetical protein M885DRAFT_504795 [Pelagophyceae sp. CCMP2097]|nr:hypothetical protein M885DRAFT_504795 [Pelagophyceae sp. CCMP2097]|mmetsp:Transcript_32199/g.108422  ORF Transcript_32199/g.108422 Transcript_32199/m.108422 type:complete len:301 (-) Transcript_32199:261-1163(-)
MEVWQRAYGGRVLFLCVCVESAAVARDFSRRMLQTCANCLVAPGDMPRFPAQLGCGGFVVIDGAGKFVTTKTMSFNDRGDRAFRALENILEPQLRFAVGARVELKGLVAAAERNGQRGAVARGVDAQGRVGVTLDDGTALAIKPDNLSTADGFEETGDAAQPDDDDAYEPKPLAAVGHAEMDAEHAALSDGLRSLMASPSAAALASARDAFKEHAAHEEDVMRAAGFGGDGGPYSALASHAADHARIVSMADGILAAAPSAAPALRDVRRFARAVERHADAFDGLYVGKLDASAPAARGT